MAYSDFDLKRVTSDFGLRAEGGVNLFHAAVPLSPGERLTAWLDEYVPLAIGLGTEAVRSQYLIAPIFAEARRLSGAAFHVLPGVTFDVDRERGLAGVCDYLFTRSREVFFVKSPIVAVAEAKRDDMTGGIGQRAAEMVAVRVYNEREGSPTPVVWGCVTTGSVWRFLKLEADTLFLDRIEYALPELPTILGILVHIGRD